MEGSQKHHRKSIRLKDYDYSEEGEYFLTIVTQKRLHLFGEIIHDEMQLSSEGKIVNVVLQSLPDRYPQIVLGAVSIMPNHIHCILEINDMPVGAIHELPLPINDGFLNGRISRRKMFVPLVVGYLKMNSAKRINAFHATPGIHVWQRNYYEHIILSDDEYDRIDAYINSNPANWLNDPEYSDE